MRSYSLVRDKHEGFVLHGTHGKPWWESTYHSECNGSQDRCRTHLLNAAKHDTCLCGVHALYGREIQHQYKSFIYASVVGWGAIAYREKGWRAEFVRMDTIWVDPACQICKPVHGLGWNALGKPLKEEAVNLADWVTYRSRQGSATLYCTKHLQEMILSNYFVKNGGVRFQEMIDGLKERYKDTEINIGSPW